MIIDIITGTFNIAELNCSVEILIGCVLGNDRIMGEGLVVFLSLLTLKKGTRSSNF